MFTTIFSSLNIPYFALAASTLGLLASVTIYVEKRKKKKLICPLRANCEKVVHSTHATTFGIPNELLGVLYYVAIAAFYTAKIAYPTAVLSPWIPYAIVLMTLVGVLFSLHLVVLQAIVIRAWCSWCMLSAFASFILALCLFGMPFGVFVPFLVAHKSLWLMIHGIGFILGVGAATVTDVFFFKFLKTHTISEEGKQTFDTLTSVIWMGLAVLLVSGFMIYLPQHGHLSQSPKFLLKLIVIGVIIVNGILLNLIVSPRMRQLSFDGTKPARHFRRLAFALGAISLTSWYTAFFLGSLRHLGKYTLLHGITMYAVVLFVAVVGSQLFERIMVRHYHALPENYSS